MRIAKKMWAGVCALGVIVGLLTGIPALLDSYGLYLGPFFGWFACNSGWLLPIATFIVGAYFGQAIKELSAKRSDKELIHEARSKALAEDMEKYLKSIRETIERVKIMNSTEFINVLQDGNVLPAGDTTRGVLLTPKMMGQAALDLNEYMGEAKQFAPYRTIAYLEVIRNLFKEVSTFTFSENIPYIVFAEQLKQFEDDMEKHLNKLQNFLIEDLDSPSGKLQRTGSIRRVIWFRHYVKRMNRLYTNMIEALKEYKYF